MTDAHSKYKLSKLELFTPNALFPDLPPLRLGTLSTMGTLAIMIHEADVISRREYIRRLLGKNQSDKAYMRKRGGFHMRIVQRLGLVFTTNLRWECHIMAGTEEYESGMVAAQKFLKLERKGLGLDSDLQSGEVGEERRLLQEMVEGAVWIGRRP
jgi:hypothetical protein